MSCQIRPFASDDAHSVRDLFVKVNRLLAPVHLAKQFEAYIALSLRQEIERIPDYYAERKGAFWVAECGGVVVGMFGLETVAAGVMELRRMYVAPDFRRRGIARAMLEFAEGECRTRHVSTLVLSTSELQPAALNLYAASGYRLTGETIARTPTNKTLGGGIRRYSFMKRLRDASRHARDKQQARLLRLNTIEGCM